MKKEHKTKPKNHHHERDRIVKWKYAQVGLIIVERKQLSSICMY